MFLITFTSFNTITMYLVLVFAHSIVRWLVLVSLVYAIFRAYKGHFSNKAFTKTDDSVRHWTATIAHIQIVIGILLYTQSPTIKYFWSSVKEVNSDAAFFGLVHIALMLAAIVVVTVGSALAKRKQTDKDKFKSMLVWFSVSLIIILIAIPWPFSPFANRPYFRTL